MAGDRGLVRLKDRASAPQVTAAASFFDRVFGINTTWVTNGLDPNELPGDELRRVLDQMCEHGESLGPERNLLRALPELRVCRVETKSAKAQRLALLHYQNITGT